MNCIEFHQKLMEDPGSSEAAFLEHAASCSSCFREYEQALAFEIKLLKAVHVPTPEDLESRIVLAQARRQERSPWRKDSLWLAAAAGLLLTLGSMLWIRPQGILTGSEPEVLSAMVLDHIHGETEHLTEHGVVSEREVQVLLAEFGAKATGILGEVRFAGRCHMHNQDGVHLVLAGVTGPVTVLIMPGEGSVAVETIDSSGFTGVVIPTGYGSLAVVGEKGEFLEPVLNRMQERLLWGA